MVTELNLNDQNALSKNNITPIKVLLHAIKKISKIKNFDHIILLQPTSPLRKVKDIDKCIEILRKKNWTPNIYN